MCVRKVGVGWGGSYIPRKFWRSPGSLMYFKVNKSRYIALFVLSGSIKKFFSIDCVVIYLNIIIIFSISFARWRSIALPCIAYMVTLKFWVFKVSYVAFRVLAKATVSLQKNISTPFFTLSYELPCSKYFRNFILYILH